MTAVANERDAFAVMQILENVKAGVSALEAAVEAGWTPAQFYRKMGDPEFAQLIREHEDVANSHIETCLYEAAGNGNVTAQLTILYNRIPHKWSDRKRVDITTGVTVNVALVEGTKEAVRALFAEDPVQMARALAPGGELDEPEVISDETL